MLNSQNFTDRKVLKFIQKEINVDRPEAVPPYNAYLQHKMLQLLISEK